MRDAVILAGVFVAAAVMLPVGKVAGAYVVLALTMWIVGTCYLWKYIKSRQFENVGTAFLVLGIALSFTGHALDQTLWASVSTMNKINGSLDFRQMILANAEYVIIFGKSLASLGALFHLRLFTQNHWPHLTMREMVLIWISLWAGITYLIAWI